MAKIIIAVGGNALGETAQEQMQLVNQAAKPIADLIQDGNQVVVVHGNGPQVGMIHKKLNSSEGATAESGMPLPECGAMSQGYIGYHLQNAITNELRSRSIQKAVVTVVTQTLVDPKDPAFENPSKPIGSFYTKEQAKELEAQKGYTMMEDAGRGYRQAVASPSPVDILEKDCIANLIEAGHIVIATGGGGIPMAEQNGRIVGVDAVIDKDFAAAKLAELVGADMLIILTAVDRIAVNYGKPNQKFLSEVTLTQAEQYCAEGHFAPGSMLPKVQAAMAFTKSSNNRRAIIGSLEQAPLAVKGLSGTVFLH